MYAQAKPCVCVCVSSVCVRMFSAHGQVGLDDTSTVLAVCVG